MRRAVLGPLLLVPLLAGCVATSPTVGGPGPGRAIDAELARLEQAGDPSAVLAFVEREWARAPRGETRARLELARARALHETGRSLSALTAFDRAWRETGASRDGLGADILVAWGDVALGSGRGAEAARRYETALDGLLETVRRRQVTAALVLALERDGRPEEAIVWRQRLGRDASRLVEAARRRVGLPGPRSPAPTPPPLARARTGSIPVDPRRIDPRILPREAWRARPIRSNHDTMGSIEAVTVHHSAMPAPSPAGVIDHLQQIQRLHVEGRGWADVGYHFLVDPQGSIWEGRALRHQGAHAGNATANAGNIGICLLGDFERQGVPARQFQALERLLDRLCAHFGLGPDDVHTHREWKATVCPGRHLQAGVSRYRSSPSPLALQ